MVLGVRRVWAKRESSVLHLGFREDGTRMRRSGALRSVRHQGIDRKVALESPESVMVQVGLPSGGAVNGRLRDRAAGMI